MPAVKCTTSDAEVTDIGKHLRNDLIARSRIKLAEGSSRASAPESRAFRTDADRELSGISGFRQCGKKDESDSAPAISVSESRTESFSISARATDVARVAASPATTRKPWSFAARAIAPAPHIGSRNRLFRQAAAGRWRASNPKISGARRLLPPRYGGRDLNTDVIRIHQD